MSFAGMDRQTGRQAGRLRDSMAFWSFPDFATILGLAEEGRE